MFLGYASQHGHTLIDRALYLPTDWAEDADRRKEARVPADVAITTKPAESCGFARRSRAWPCWSARGLRACRFPGANAARFAWIAGDSVYGADHAIRRWAERHRRGYVLAVTSGQRLGLRPVTAWVKKLPKRAWQPAQILRTSLAQRRGRRQRAALLRLGVPALQRQPLASSARCWSAAWSPNQPNKRSP